MRLVGSEERALWSAAYIAAVSKLDLSTASWTAAAEAAATIADAAIFEYRKRCG